MLWAAHISCYAGQQSGLANPSVSVQAELFHFFSIQSLIDIVDSLSVSCTNYNISASPCVIPNFVAVKGTSVIVTSPPITLINYPNRVVGPMTQVTEDIAEAVEFVLRYDVESRNNLPGVYS